MWGSCVVDALRWRPAPAARRGEPAAVDWVAVAVAAAALRWRPAPAAPRGEPAAVDWVALAVAAALAETGPEGMY